MNYLLKKIPLHEWLEGAKEFNDYNYTHFWAYGHHAAARVGAESENMAIVDDNNLIMALFNVRIKKIPFNLGGIAFISGGVMIDKGQDNIDETLLTTLTVLQKEYIDTRQLVLRIAQRPKINEVLAKETRHYQQFGFSEQRKIEATILVDLSAEVEFIRKKLHQKWRNILNKSEKQSLELVSGHDLKLFSDFEGLFADLLQRKNLTVDMDNHFFKAVQADSEKEEKFHLAIAYSKGQPISGHLSSIVGNTSVYILGATNDLGRKLGAAYFLQWHVILQSKQQGCHWYDLGGIDPIENPHVYQFKKRMGGEETEKGTVFQYHSGIRGQAVLLLESLYQRLRS